MALRDWLVFSRTHTAALTIPGVVLAAHLANPATTPLTLALFGVFAWLAHGSGFSCNNLFDLPWDGYDPAKAHHPLVAGRIHERDAWLVTLLASFAALLLGAYLTRNHPAGLLALGGFIAFGTLYNHQCKVSLLGPVWIAVSFACLPLYGWLAVGGGWSLTVAYIVAYCLVLMFGQIAVSGYVKDLGRTMEVNWLRRMGARVHGEAEWDFPPSVVALAFWSRYACAMLGASYVVLTTWDWVESSVEATLLGVWGGAAVALPMMRVVQSGHFPRDAKVRAMGVAEIVAYWLLVATLAPSLGVAWTVGLVAGPLAYYVAANRFFWGPGHAVGPAV